jgi:hypothetical protein
MKFGYFFDETGNCHFHNEEAAVVRFVFTRYVNDHKPMDVLSYILPMEVSPGILGGNEWRRHHVHTILSDPNYAGVQSDTKRICSRAIPSYHSNRPFHCSSSEALETDQPEF